MFRPSAVLLVALLACSACADKMRTKEQVQAAILDRLRTRSGLDLNTIDVTTTSVNFEQNKAFATVAFHPKGDTNVSSAMVMKYTLEDRDGRWAVVGVSDSRAHSSGGAPTGAGQLPPGHPSVDQAPPGDAGQGPHGRVQ